jgi:acetylglutamate kinase
MVTTVVKLGGTTLEAALLAGLTAEIATAYRLVIVHGGGKRLSEWLDRLGIPSRFEGGLRVTDVATLEVATAVFGGLVNTELVGTLQNAGVPAVGLTGLDGGLLVGRRMPELGRVATVVGILREVVDAQLAAGYTPVVAPLALDENGELCNVNADDAAAGLAAGLGARLLLLTDTPGVLDERGQTITALEHAEAERLIAAGQISTGMVPKVRGAFEALRSGAVEVVIAGVRAEGGVRAALEGSGAETRIGGGHGTV